MDNDHPTKGKFLAALAKNVASLMNEPFSVMSECDFQAGIFADLRTAITETVQTTDGFDGKNKHSIPVILTEYYSRFDLVCVDAQRAQKYVDGPRPESKTFSALVWSLPLLIAVELKFVPFEQYHNGPNLFHDDIEKLERVSKKHVEEFRVGFDWIHLTLFQNPKTCEKFASKERIGRGGAFEVNSSPGTELAFNRAYLISSNVLFRSVQRELLATKAA